MRRSGTFDADPREPASPLRTAWPAAERPTLAALALTPSPCPSPFYQHCLELLAPLADPVWSSVRAGLERTVSKAHLYRAAEQAADRQRWEILRRINPTGGEAGMFPDA